MSTVNIRALLISADKRMANVSRRVQGGCLILRNYVAIAWNATTQQMRPEPPRSLPTPILFTSNFTLTEGFPCFFLSCKANARVILAKTGHGRHSSVFVLSLLVLLFYGYFILLYIILCFILLYVILYYSMYYFILLYVTFECISVQTTATWCLPNCSWQLYQYQKYQ
jgi:hypothetical protein